MRSLLLDTALASFDPDLFVVDKVARGVHGELDLALTALCDHGHTRTVLAWRTRAPARARRAIDLGGTTVIPRLADRLCHLRDPAEEVPHVAV